MAISKGERTAQRILDEAEVLFARRGYSATSLRDIAQAASLREPGIYNHFANKQALYCAVLDRALQPLADQLDRLLQEQENDALAELPGSMSALLAQHPYIAALFQQALMQRGQPELAAMENWLERLVDQGRALFRQQIGPVLSDDEIALRIVMMFNINAGYFVAEPLLQHLTGKSAQQLLARQQALTNRVMQQLLASDSRAAAQK